MATAVLDRKKLNPPDTATTLSEAVRMTLGVMGELKAESPGTLAAAVWLRLAHARARKGKDSVPVGNVHAVEEVLLVLVNEGVLTFCEPEVQVAVITALPRRVRGTSPILDVTSAKAG